MASNKPPGIAAAVLIWALTLYMVSTTADVSASPLDTLLKNSNKFCTEFFQEIMNEKKHENFIISPLSAYMLLSSLAYGAQGYTFDLLRQKLNLPVNISNADDGFRSLINDLNNIKGANLVIANKIYLAENYSLKSAYNRTMTNVFNTAVSKFDATSTSAANDINNWVDKKTNNKISKRFKSEDIKQDTRLISLNALYLKSQWKYKFETLRHRKIVPTLYNTHKYFFGDLPDLDARFIEIPYNDEELKMIIILPNDDDGLEEYATDFASLTYDDLWSERNRTAKGIALRLPIFKIESSIDLRDTFKKLKIGHIFNDWANFKGMSDERLKVDKFIQKVYIEMDEAGSENPNPGKRWDLERNSFIVDRPFYFFIVKSNITILQGQVLYPRVG